MFLGIQAPSQANGVLANNYFKVFNTLSFQQNVNYGKMAIIKKTSTIYAGEDVEKEPLFTIGIIN